MNKVIKDIIISRVTNQEKYEILDSFLSDIHIAKGILSGVYTYCPECDDYYLSKSYFIETETKKTKICVYDDPINSGGDEYVDGYADITYNICPKGHKQEIGREERRK